MFKFHDDPMVNEFKIVVFLRQVWWHEGKREDFGRRRIENEIETKRSIVSLKTDLRCLYL